MDTPTLPPLPSEQQHDALRYTNPNQKAWLDVHGIPGGYEDHAGVVIMFAPRTEEVLRLIDDFNSNASVPVIDFITALQAVRQKIHTMRPPRSSRPAGR